MFISILSVALFTLLLFCFGKKTLKLIKPTQNYLNKIHAVVCSSPLKAPSLKHFVVLKIKTNIELKVLCFNKKKYKVIESITN